MADEREVALSGCIRRETEKAYLFKLDDGGEPGVWIPKSVVTDMTEDWAIGESIDMFVKPWFAEKEGLG